MIRTLLFSTLYPSSVRPIHGIFVETRLRELLKSGLVETRVVAPVPWFPFADPLFGDYGRFANTPLTERRNGIEVHHPRYALLPKIGMNIAPYTLALGALGTLMKLIRQGFNFDLIDAHYYYPDGVAAAILAKWLNKPFVVTARGSDLNVISKYRYPRKLMRQTANEAHASIGVSESLVKILADLGVNNDKLFVFRNGVDLELFQPEKQKEARSRLGLPDKKTLFSVGNLVELKGHHIVIEALDLLPNDISLVIAGDGPEKQRLEALARQRGVSERVRFAGQIPNADLKWWYSASDALVLCSSREGWPNVLLESMACGTPVVATNVGGTREIIRDPVVGCLLNERNPQELANACKSLLLSRVDRTAVRNYAENFGWELTTKNQIGLFEEIINSCATSS